MDSNWLDEVVAVQAEAVARPLSRRGMIRRALDFGFKGSLVIVLGLANARKAWAEACGCSPAGGRWCSNCPPSSSVCPAGYVTCTRVNGTPQAEGCVWTGGWWDEDCGDGTCRTCVDCWPAGGGTFNSSCTCRSQAFNCGGGGDPCDGWEICQKCKCI